MTDHSTTLRTAAETLRDEVTTADEALEARDWHTAVLTGQELHRLGFATVTTAELVADWLDYAAKCWSDPLPGFVNHLQNRALALAEHINERASNG